MEFQILGPIEILSDGNVLSFPRRKQRLILGILALDSGRAVAVDRLIDLIWGERPPQQARATMHTRISEARAILAAAQQRGGKQVVRLARSDNGYVLDAPPDWVDVHRFRDLVDQARLSKSDIEARDALDVATQLWRGPALGGWLPHESHQELCQGLESARVSALENLFEVELRLGRHHHVVERVVQACVSNVNRERLSVLSMLALHRCARTPEALLAYERYRRWAEEELGIDPSPQFQELYLSILRNDHAVAVGDPAPSDRYAKVEPVAANAVGPPNSLPSDIADFTGREAEVAHLTELVLHPRAGVPLVAVTGPAGVGKTAFTIHIAHQLRAHFPDGQLFADLHGADWEHPPTSAQLIARFLQALGVQSGIPDELDERTDLYRRVLADRKVLIVLDNAASANQIIPLVPGSPSCAVLVNSRGRVGASLGAESVELGVLATPHAMELLGRLVGRKRVQSQRSAAEALIQLCGGLPLAIRIAGAKLAAKPHWSIDLMIDRLGSEQRRLDHLSHDHLSVRSSIEFSYTSLKPDGQRLIRRLGDVGYPEVNVWSAAALLDTDIAEAEEVLEHLHDAQLVDIAGAEANGYTRYRLHDLVRIFAAERAADDESPVELNAARTRVFGAWLHVLQEVEGWAAGGRYLSVRSEAPKWTIEPGFLAGIATDPLKWFDSERSAIVHMIRRASEIGYIDFCWGLAVASSPLCQMRASHDDWQVSIDIAHHAALQIGDELGRGALLVRMGTLSIDRLTYGHARDQLEAAQEVFSAIDEDYGFAVATAVLAVLDRFEARNTEALAGLIAALPGLRMAGDQIAEALVLRNVGQVYLENGDLLEANDQFDRALTLAHACGARRAEAQIWLCQGLLCQKLAQFKEAERLFLRVVEVARAIGDHGGHALTLYNLAMCYKIEGKFAPAHAALSRALPLVSRHRPNRIEAPIRKELAILSGALGREVEASS